MIYLDHASTTPLLPEVISVVNDVLTESWGNPSSSHANGRKAKAVVETARKTFATDFGVTPGEIFFTSGATESIFLGLQSAILDGCDFIITAATEHKAVLDSVDFLAQKHQIKKLVLAVNNKGQISMTELENAIKAHPGKTLVALMYVNNETGLIHPVKSIGQIVGKYDGLFFCDAVQAALFQDITPRDLGIHYLSLSAHKFNGPKGVGLLFVARETGKHSLWKGGSQERKMRPGTENVYGIAGMAKAWRSNFDSRMEKRNLMADLKSIAIKALNSIPGLEINAEDGAPHILHFSFPSAKKAEQLLMALDIEGVMLSAGSACQSGSHQVSHVIEAMNKPGNQIHLRMSFGFGNTKDQVLSACQTLVRLVS
ncbi:MAG: cysteine desulfurase [Cryomorphaceae bacterium]|nr:cysteine desulfurase [Cryomorphaceae bacterium]